MTTNDSSAPRRSRLLPPEFDELEPFAETWALATEPERWDQRQASSMDELQTFYDVIFPRAEEAIAYCDKFELDAMPDDALRLFRMLHSLVMVSYAVEVWHQQQPVDVGAAHMDRTREPQP